MLASGFTKHCFQMHSAKMVFVDQFHYCWFPVSCFSQKKVWQFVFILVSTCHALNLKFRWRMLEDYLRGSKILMVFTKYWWYTIHKRWMFQKDLFGHPFSPQLAEPKLLFWLLTKIVICHIWPIFSACSQNINDTQYTFPFYPR